MNATSVARTSQIISVMLFTAVATTVYAGPGPQYWNRGSTPAKRPGSSAATSPSVSPKPACPGCRTIPIVVPSERGPAGKGVSATTQVGTRHDCVYCRDVAKSAPAGTAAQNHAAKCVESRCCPTPMAAH